MDVAKILTNTRRSVLSVMTMLTIVFIFSSCGLLLKVPPDEVYLKKHTVVIEDEPDEFRVESDDMTALLRPKTNRKILGMRLNHSIYNLVNKRRLAKSELRAKERCVGVNAKRKSKGKSDKECQSWLMFWAYTVGEPTVFLDSALVDRSEKQLEVFLKKKGYFNVAVEPEIKFLSADSSRCKVLYHTKPGNPYRISEIRYVIEDPVLARKLTQIIERSAIQPCVLFDVDVIDRERDIITEYFNNEGYFDFSKDYIVVDADSTIGNQEVNLTMRINNRNDPNADASDSTGIPHRKYFLGDVYLHTNQGAFDQTLTPRDTLRYRGLKVLSSGEPILKPIVLDYTTTLYRGDTYSKSKVDQTYKRFSHLQVFQSVNIQLEATEANDSTEFNILDTHIYLQPSRKQTLSLDPKLTHRDGALGVYANLVYTNRNLFRGAEKLEIRNILGFEAARSLTESGVDGSYAELVSRNVKLNTFEIGPEVIFKVPRILPLSLDRFKRSNDPQTSISASLNYQSRPDYQRTLSRLVYGNSMIENPAHGSRVFIDWAEISIIKIQKSEAFEQFIVDLDDEFLANSYRDHFITASRLGWVLNTQRIVQQPKYMYLRAYVEGAGNLLRRIYESSSAPLDEAGSYELAGIRFAQYVKAEVDFRFYRNINETNALASRANVGWGLPGKNLSALPFEKSFFSGGSNSIRAWQARTLGPGSFRDTTAIRTYNNIGEIKIEVNLEYRFKMTQMFHGAWFLDMGNIWLQKPDPLRPGSDFSRKDWLGEVAVGTGIGIRLDFEFFLVRFDLGVQVKDPSKVKGERWWWEPKDQYKLFLARLGATPNAIDATFNLGIGYPF
jgi:hypothetical protein